MEFWLGYQIQLILRLLVVPSKLKIFPSFRGLWYLKVNSNSAVPWTLKYANRLYQYHLFSQSLYGIDIFPSKVTKEPFASHCNWKLQLISRIELNYAMTFIAHTVDWLYYGFIMNVLSSKEMFTEKISMLKALGSNWGEILVKPSHSWPSAVRNRLEMWRGNQWKAAY